MKQKKLAKQIIIIFNLIKQNLLVNKKLSKMKEILKMKDQLISMKKWLSNNNKILIIKNDNFCFILSKF